MVDEVWLSTVRIARDCGDISSLFPPGITRLVDLPFTLHAAVSNALTFLSYRENMPEKDQPPKRIWLDTEKMEQWWREVKAAREAEAKGESYRDMPENELMKEIFPGVRGG